LGRRIALREYRERWLLRILTEGRWILIAIEPCARS
jgi:hypothetical protein